MRNPGAAPRERGGWRAPHSRRGAESLGAAGTGRRSAGKKENQRRDVLRTRALAKQSGVREGRRASPMTRRLKRNTCLTWRRLVHSHEATRGH
ncbi:hypothetical protein EYF80_048108 [Liparis tanakae]|uniref:Uncharacterized protein n=1 Tax=Liparis tanakae TaxID=230148 RepID=A0A4Z2FKN7_9TELE|nr:hypothetical protein EYF80_048108 [Liparis tanakae]